MQKGAKYLITISKSFLDLNFSPFISTDGFFISEEDLRLRGPGDFFGTRQSGVPVLESMTGELDTEVLYKARNAIEDLKDKKLSADSNEKKVINFMINKNFIPTMKA